MTVTRELLVLRQILEAQLAESGGERRARVQLIAEEERIKEMIGARPTLVFLAVPLERIAIEVDGDDFQVAIRKTGIALSSSGYEFRPTSQGLATAERWDEPGDAYPSEWRIDYHFDGFLGGYAALRVRDGIGYYADSIRDV